MADEFKGEDFDRVIEIEGAIAKSLFPFAANTPTRLAIFALGRVLKALLRKCDAETRAIYMVAISETIERMDESPNLSADVREVTRLFRFH